MRPANEPYTSQNYYSASAARGSGSRGSNYRGDQGFQPVSPRAQYSNYSHTQSMGHDQRHIEPDFPRQPDYRGSSFAHPQANHFEERRVETQHMKSPRNKFQQHFDDPDQFRPLKKAETHPAYRHSSSRQDADSSTRSGHRGSRKIENIKILSTQSARNSRVESQYSGRLEESHLDSKPPHLEQSMRSSLHTTSGTPLNRASHLQRQEPKSMTPNNDQLHYNPVRKGLLPPDGSNSPVEYKPKMQNIQRPTGSSQSGRHSGSRMYNAPPTDLGIIKENPNDQFGSRISRQPSRSGSRSGMKFDQPEVLNVRARHDHTESSQISESDQASKFSAEDIQSQIQKQIFLQQELMQKQQAHLRQSVALQQQLEEDPFNPQSRSKIYVSGQDNEESSLVDSAEKRDKVSMAFDLDASQSERKIKKRKFKSAVAGGGNFLRVRSNSNASRSGLPGVGSLSGVSNAINDPQEHFDYFYKMIIIGDEKVGKTNFLLRVANGIYDPNPKTTFGVEFVFKTVPLADSNQKVRTQLWDTSGAKQFLSITTTHYRFAVGAFLVYDITNYESFINLKDWVQKIREFSDPDVVIALIGNKKDLVDHLDSATGAPITPVPKTAPYSPKTQPPPRQQMDRSQERYRNNSGVKSFQEERKGGRNYSNTDYRPGPPVRKEQRSHPLQADEGVQKSRVRASPPKNSGYDKLIQENSSANRSQIDKTLSKGSFNRKNTLAYQEVYAYKTSSHYSNGSAYEGGDPEDGLEQQQVASPRNNYVPGRGLLSNSSPNNPRGYSRSGSRARSPSKSPMRSTPGVRAKSITQRQDPFRQRRQSEISGAEINDNSQTGDRSFIQGSIIPPTHPSVVQQNSQVKKTGGASIPGTGVNSEVTETAKFASQQSHFNASNQVPYQPVGVPPHAVSVNDIQGSLISSQGQQYSSQLSQQEPVYRQVTLEAAEKFASKENLIFLGETSCKDGVNCENVFDLVMEKVHAIQTDLVRQGIKNIEDLRYGEEERSVNYNRCCY